MALPSSFKEELRSRLPVSEVVGKRVRLVRAGREFKACCPFHNEKSPSFYINDEKKFYHCFGCGAHGDIISFLMQHDKLSFPEAIEQLAGLAGMEVPRDTPAEREHYDQEKRLHQLLERATTFFEEQLFGSHGREALAYLRSRGLSDDAVQRFRLGYAPGDGQTLIRKMLSEKYTVEELIATGLAKKSEERDQLYSFFRNRVIFPVGDRRGRTVAFGGRVMGEGEPKYLNSPDHVLFHKGKLLYGLSRARTALDHNQPLIVVEGYMDVIALVEAGFSGAVAPLGTALTEEQLDVVWKLLPRTEHRDPGRDYSPILCFDGDNAGLKAAVRAMERAMPLLTPAHTIRIATMPKGQDPDDLIRQGGRSAMDAVIAQAKPMIDMIWETAMAGRRLQTPEDRGNFQTTLRYKVSQIRDEALRRLYIEEIQKRLAAQFNWRSDPRPKSGFTPYKGRGFGKKGESPPMPLNVARNRPPSARRQREKAFLALMINYPDLFAEFGEHFAQIEFSVDEFEALRARVTDILSQDSPEPLDAAGLYRHLSTGDGADFTPESGLAEALRAGLEEVLSESTYRFYKFTRTDGALSEARRGWKSIWTTMQKEQVKTDLDNARREHKESQSDESYQRMMNLREQLESLTHDGEDSGSTDPDYSSQESTL